MKEFWWFVGGLAFGEFALRWIIHVMYLGVIAALLCKIFM